MFEVALTVLGGLFGFVLSTAYEKAKDRRLAKQISFLLQRELDHDIEALETLLSTSTALNDPEMPKFCTARNLKEIGQGIAESCKREAFDACLRDIPVLGPAALEALFAFHEQATRLPSIFDNMERFATNIRHGLFEDYIQDLINRAQRARGFLAV